MTFTALIKFPHVAIGVQWDTRKSDNTPSQAIDHPTRAISDRPGLAKCRPAILTQGKAVGV